MSKMICRFYLLFAFFVLFVTDGQCQSLKKKIDSLNNEFQNGIFDSIKIDSYLNLIEEVYIQDPDNVIPLSEKLINIVEKIYPATSSQNQKYLLGVKANCLNNIGAIYNQKGNAKRALQFFHESLKLKEALCDLKSVSSTLNNIGYLYGSIKDFDNALVYYKKSLSLKEKFNDKKGIARLLNNIGSIYDERGDTLNTFLYYRKSYDMAKQMDDKLAMAFASNNIGFTFDKLGNNRDALRFYEQGLQLRLEQNDKLGIAESYNNIGNIYFKTNDLAKSKEYALKAFAISKELNYPENIMRASHLLKSIYLNQRNYEKAYEMYDLYIAMRDTIMSEENRDEALKKSFEYEYEKKVVADSIKNYEFHKYESIKHESEISKQRSYTYGGVVAFLLMLVIAVLSFRGYKQKIKANQEITQQKKIIEGKQKEIIDSIEYAKRIQLSQLPSEKYIDRTLKKINKNSQKY